MVRLVRFVKPTNEFQLQVIRLGTDLTTPETAVFDGVGTLIQRPDAYGFHWVLWSPEVARYWRGELPPAAATVRAGGGRLVLLTYRVLALPDLDLRALLRQFPRLWGPICVPGFDSGPPGPESPTSMSFELWYEGDYEVFPPGDLDRRSPDRRGGAPPRRKARRAPDDGRAQARRPGRLVPAKGRVPGGASRLACVRRLRLRFRLDAPDHDDPGIRRPREAVVDMHLDGREMPLRSAL